MLKIFCKMQEMFFWQTNNPLHACVCYYTKPFFNWSVGKTLFKQTLLSHVVPRNHHALIQAKQHSKYFTYANMFNLTTTLLILLLSIYR